MYTELKVKTVATRKPHKCSWCAEQIDARNFAIYRVYIYDYQFCHEWMHQECANALGELDTQGEEVFYPGEFARGKCHA